MKRVVGTLARAIFAALHLLAPVRVAWLTIHRLIVTAIVWGPRAIRWHIDPTVHCNRPDLVELGYNGYIGPNVTLIIKESFDRPGDMGRIILGDGLQVMGHTTLTAMGGSIEIKRYSTIGTECHLGAFDKGIQIGQDVLIASGVSMVDTQHGIKPDQVISYQPYTSRGIAIGDGVWLGADVTILDGCEIGEGAVVGAGAVVTKSVPPNAIAIGIPASVKSYRSAISDTTLSRTNR